jgi:hypothetical protein
MRKGIILAALGGLLALAAPANAASVTPTMIGGNPSCAGGTKIEPVASETYAVEGGTVTITTSEKSFSFTSTVLVTSVLVKGGPAGNLYTYPAPGVTADSDLVAPNGRGLSHLCFFTGDKKPEDPKDPK